MELFKDVINGILNNNKKLFDSPEAEQVYNAFMVNRALSYHTDTLYLSNQMNQLHTLTKRDQITFYLNTIRANKRPFTKWAKPVKVEDLESVKTYFGYSDRRALDAMKILTDEQITLIKERIKTGE